MLIIYSWDLVELTFVYFFYVETRGPTLEELAKIFDGEDAMVGHVDINNMEKDIHVHHSEENLSEKKPVVASTPVWLRDMLIFDPYLFVCVVAVKL